MSGYKEIGATELHTQMASSKMVLIDVRSDEEAAKGMIKGALHMPLALLPVKVEELTAGDTPLVFYCHSGIRSAQASAFISDKGRSNVSNLRGGILAWGAAGYPLLPQS